MLKTLRNPKHVKRIMLWTLVLIIPAFVLFYGWSSITGTDDRNATYATKVNGKEISIAQYHDQYGRLMEEARKQYGDQFTEDVAREMNLGAQVMEEMENKELLMQEAKKMGIQVSDDEINLSIRSNRNFQTSGKFDPALYRRILADQKMTPEYFENELRTERTLGRLQRMVTDFVKVSEAEVREAYRKETDKMTIDYVRFATPDYIAKVNVTDQETQAYYNSHKTEYQIPPLYKINYIVIDPKTYEAGVQINDAMIKDFYESEIGSFVIPEKAHVRHLVIPIAKENPQAAQAAQKQIIEAAKKLQAGEPFDQVEKAYSKASPEFASQWVTRGQTGQAEYENFIFSLALNKPSQPLVMGDGYHIILVDKKEASKTKPLDEVKPEIISKLKSLAADTTAEAKCEEIQKQAHNNPSLSALASKNGFTVSATDWFSNKNLPVLAENKDFANELINMNKGQINGPFRSANGFYLVQLVDKQNSRIPPYTEVADKVKARVLFNKAQEAAQKAALKAEDDVKKGMTLDQIAAANGIKISELGPVTSSTEVPGLGKRSNLLNTAFYLPEGKTSGIITVKDPMGQGFVQYFMIRVKTHVPGDETTFLEVKDKLVQTLLQHKKQEAFSEYLKALRKRAKIKRNQRLLAEFQAPEQS
jgi:peptidyl-prolyl cis-trans isomerase D